MIENADPTVPTYAEHSQTSGAWVLYVQCPFCGDVHTHGGGSIDGPPDMGHRVSHCVTHEAAGYTLVPGPADMPKPQRKPYRQRLRDLEAYDRQRGISPTANIKFY